MKFIILIMYYSLASTPGEGLSISTEPVPAGMETCMQLAQRRMGLDVIDTTMDPAPRHIEAAICVPGFSAGRPMQLRMSDAGNFIEPK